MRSFKNWCFLFIIFPIVAFCSSPRLLITLGPKCDFSSKKLKRAVHCKVVSGTAKKMKKKIKQLDKRCQDHIIILDGIVEDIEHFSRSVGYETIYLNETFKKALAQLKAFVPTVSSTDADLPRTSPHDIGRFYDMLMKVDTIFKKHNLQYWAQEGTLLGAVRHRGMIPWDDDIDIGIHAKQIPLLREIEGALSDAGLELFYYEAGEIYKIFPKDGIPCPKKDGCYPWKYPFIDIAPLIEFEGKITYVRERWRKRLPGEYFLPEQLVSPLTSLPFGPTEIPVPHNYLDYIVRAYGEDWNESTYVRYDHKNEKYRKKIRVDLVDRSPPPYILP